MHFFFGSRSDFFLAKYEIISSEAYLNVLSGRNLKSISFSILPSYEPKIYILQKRCNFIESHSTLEKLKHKIPMADVREFVFLLQDLNRPNP